MAEGGFNDYDDRIEEKETNVDDPRDMVQEQESQYSFYDNDLENLRKMTVETAVDLYYEKLEEMGQGKLEVYFPDIFKLLDGELRPCHYPDVRLTKANGEPLKLSSIRSKYGAEVIRKGLGFSDYGYKKTKIKPKEKKRIISSSR